MPDYKEYIVRVFADLTEWGQMVAGKFERHREDGPACEYADGDKFWYLNNELHRVDGPAEEYADGTKHWYLNGKLHRVDGPAVENADGDKYWYLNNEEYSEAEFNKYLADKKASCGKQYKLTAV